MKKRPKVAPSVRTPRQARSVETQRRVLEATIESLVEIGYARTSTVEVALRADVSQASVFKHFGSKALLLGCAVSTLFETLVDEFRAQLAALPDHGSRVHTVLELLWAAYQTPRLQAVFELYGVARTDRDLRDALASAVERHRAVVREMARRLFPEVAASIDFEPLMDSVVDALQGRALRSIVLPEPEAEKALLKRLEREIELALVTAAARPTARSRRSARR